MTGVLIILVVTAATGLLLWVFDRKGHKATGETHSSGSKNEEPQPDNGHGPICCGRHAVCEKTALSPLDTTIIYYDDEELDRFSGRRPDEYSAKEEDEFREVLMTLLPEDVAGWARSIQLRQIELPAAVRDELLMIVDELRR